MQAARKTPRFVEIMLVFALLAIHGWLAVSSSVRKSLTFDEVAHLGGGLLGWQGDSRFNAESGILPQRWATWPLADLELPPPDHPARVQGNVWVVARDVLYGRGNDAEALALAARSMAALWSVVLGAVVYAVSRRLFGPAGALLSLVLYTASPTILAHGRLVTADLPVALFFLLAAWGVGELFCHVTPARVLAASLAVAGLLLSKHSGLLIVPVAVVLAAFHGLHGSVSIKALKRGAVTALTVASLVFVCVWAAYGFRYAADPRAQGAESRFVHSWESVLAQGGPGSGAVRLARDLQVLPESYLWGLAYTLDTTRERDAFLRGLTSKEGWWWFFPYAAMVKTPLPLLGLLVLAAVFWSRRIHPAGLRESLLRSAPLWTLVGVYGLAAMTSSLNIGHRHLLPLYPVAFILAGGALSGKAPRPRWNVILVLLSTALFLSESWRVRPHYLAYFNQLAGGPAQGYRHLVDSSLDWGQDLAALESWIRSFRDGGDGTPVYVSYFGTAVPDIEGLDLHWLASYFPLADYRRPPPPLVAGIYCVSATHLQSLHLSTLGPWTAERERQLREKQRELERFRGLFQTVAGREQLAGERSVADWMALFRDVDRLRSARLFRFLRTREPDDRAGFSILIYHLSEAEMRGALTGAVDGT